MVTKTAATLIITILLLILPGAAYSKIYKWVDETGRTHFSSSPPADGKADIVKPKINTYTSRKLPTTDIGQSKKRKTANKRVVMYSAVWCGICKTARNYFKKKGIAFKEYDIEASSKGRLDYKRLRGTGVPIIFVGKKRINGFDPKLFQSKYDG